MRLNSVGELIQKCDSEKREGGWRQIKLIYRWHLDLVAKRFKCSGYQLCHFVKSKFML